MLQAPHCRRHRCSVSLRPAADKAKADEHARRGNAYFEEKRYQEAIVEYRGALQADPKLGDVRLKLGDAYMRRQRPSQCAPRIRPRGATCLPNTHRRPGQGGKLLLLARQFEDAKARAERAIELDRKNVEAQIIRGNALAGLKDFDAAMAEFQDAIALDPTQTTAYSNLGILQLAKGNKDEAEATFKRAVDAAPQSLVARFALANFYSAAGNIPEAENTLKAALQIDPINVEANRALGLFYLQSGRVVRGGTVFRRGCELRQIRSRLALAGRLLFGGQTPGRCPAGAARTGREGHGLRPGQRAAGGAGRRRGAAGAGVGSPSGSSAETSQGQFRVALERAALFRRRQTRRSASSGGGGDRERAEFAERRAGASAVGADRNRQRPQRSGDQGVRAGLEAAGEASRRGCRPRPNLPLDGRRLEGDHLRAAGVVHPAQPA